MRSGMKPPTELQERLRVGSSMANLCFNLAQDDRIQGRHRDAMRELYVEWDNIKRTPIKRTARRARGRKK